MDAWAARPSGAAKNCGEMVTDGQQYVEAQPSLGVILQLDDPQFAPTYAAPMRGSQWQLGLPRIAAIIVVTILFGTVYVVAQQLDRLSANDAPLRLASQVGAELRAGESTTLDAQSHVDLSRSLAAFVVVEDAQGNPSAGSGFLHGSLISLPTGVLASAAASGQDNVTWEPESGLRFATVTLRVGDQFVSAGQSLKPSENRDGTIRLLVELAWLVSILVLSGAWIWCYLLSLRRRETSSTPD
jgi:hypothetical protein